MKALALLLLLPLGVRAADSTLITVVGESIVVPHPRGFVPVTPQMKQVDALQRQFVAPMNELFLGFIPGADEAAALNGDAILLPRSFTVQTEKRAAQANITKARFAELKRSISSQNAETIKNVEKQMPGLLEKMSKGAGKESGTDLKVTMPQMVPFPPHEDTERSIAYSMLIRMDVTAGNPQSAVGVVSVVTGTFVLVKGKILFLYCNGGEGDLEWSRDISREWSRAVLAANPAEGAAIGLFRRDSFVARVLRGALIGGVIGAVIGLVRYWTKGRKPKTGP